MNGPLATGARPRAIVHADLDAFFASVEQRDRPELRGRPVLVGGQPESRGVVAAASYEARRFGVHSAMPMRTAVRRCPHAVIVAPRFDVYARVSAQVMALFHTLSPLVEPLSLDEAYLDCGHLADFWSRAEAFGRDLKERVRAEVGLTISVGIATTKSAAKIASDLRKPDGLLIVPPGQEAAFLAPLPVGVLWGIGPRSRERLAALGVRTIGELAAREAAELRPIFGSWAETLLAMARGSDERLVTPERERKSIGRETTFAADLAPGERLEHALAELCAEVADRLQRRGLRGRTVTLKVRRADFSTHTRQITLPTAIADGDDLRAVATRLLAEDVRPGERVRLIGVSVSGFAHEVQLPLFPFRASGCSAVGVR